MTQPPPVQRRPDHANTTSPGVPALYREPSPRDVAEEAQWLREGLHAERLADADWWTRSNVAEAVPPKPGDEIEMMLPKQYQPKPSARRIIATEEASGAEPPTAPT